MYVSALVLLNHFLDRTEEGLENVYHLKKKHLQLNNLLA